MSVDSDNVDSCMSVCVCWWQVNCVEYSALCARQRVTQFPTHLFYKSGQTVRSRSLRCPLFVFINICRHLKVLLTKY